MTSFRNINTLQIDDGTTTMHNVSSPVKIQQENAMNTTYILRQSDTLVFAADSETFTFTARRLADVKRRAFRKQFHEDSNLRLEDESGKVVSIKRSGFKWEDK